MVPKHGDVFFAASLAANPQKGVPPKTGKAKYVPFSFQGKPLITRVPLYWSPMQAAPLGNSLPKFTDFKLLGLDDFSGKTKSWDLFWGQSNQAVTEFGCSILPSGDFPASQAGNSGTAEPHRQVHG